MTYRDSLKHLIAEQQRQRLNTQQRELVDKALTEHASQVRALNDNLITRLKRDLNKINGLHVQRIIQFLK